MPSPQLDLHSQKLLFANTALSGTHVENLTLPPLGTFWEGDAGQLRLLAGHCPWSAPAAERAPKLSPGSDPQLPRGEPAGNPKRHASDPRRDEES